MTPDTINLNQNASQCIQTVNNFGSTAYHNICTGTVSNVPWGTLDWAACIFVLVVFITVAAMLVAAFRD